MDRLPTGWRKYVHPCTDGVYYRHPSLRIITQEDIRQASILDRITETRNLLPDDLGCLVRNYQDDWEVLMHVEVGVQTDIYSIKAKAAYLIHIRHGKVTKHKDHDKARFWAYLAEYPSHHGNIPKSVKDALRRVASTLAGEESLSEELTEVLEDLNACLEPGRLDQPEGVYLAASAMFSYQQSLPGYTPSPH